MPDNELEVVLCNPTNSNLELSLFYRTLSNSIAEKHFAAVAECERENYPIKQPDRFHNFPGCHKDEAWIVIELNKCIDSINSYSPGTITHRAELEMSQEHMNRLHHYFVELRGGVLTPAEFVSNAPENVWESLEDFNLLIHRYEDLSWNKRIWSKWMWKRPRAFLTFAPPRPRYPLSEEDFTHFSFDYSFGSMLINYCEVGKPILGVYRDKDEICGMDNIRPLRYYSADSLLQFDQLDQVSHRLVNCLDRLRFAAWWKRNENKLRTQGFEWNDPKNSIGYITVAKLDRKKGAIDGLTEGQIVNLIGKYQTFKRVSCHSSP